MNTANGNPVKPLKLGPIRHMRREGTEVFAATLSVQGKWRGSTEGHDKLHDGVYQIQAMLHEYLHHKSPDVVPSTTMVGWRHISPVQLFYPPDNKDTILLYTKATPQLAQELDGHLTAPDNYFVDIEVAKPRAGVETVKTGNQRLV